MEQRDTTDTDDHRLRRNGHKNGIVPTALLDERKSHYLSLSRKYAGKNMQAEAQVFENIAERLNAIKSRLKGLESY